MKTLNFILKIAHYWQKLVRYLLKVNISVVWPLTVWNAEERWVWRIIYGDLILVLSQDHTSQDHFCSWSDEFPSRNLDYHHPRWWVTAPISEREAAGGLGSDCLLGRRFWGSFLALRFRLFWMMWSFTEWLLHKVILIGSFIRRIVLNV